MIKEKKMAKNNDKTEAKEPKYEDMLGIHQTNLDKFGAFFYASLMKQSGHGEEGQTNGLFASSWGLRNKIGLEGILGGLEAQGLQSIASGNGLNAQFNLGTVIEECAKAYEQSFLKLRIGDAVKYLRDTIGEETEIVEEAAYKGKQVKDLLMKESSKEEQLYGKHLLTQLGNAAIAKYTSLAYQERAARETMEYKQTIFKLQNYLPRENLALAA